MYTKDIFQALVFLKICKKTDEKTADKGQFDLFYWRNGRREEQRTFEKKLERFYRSSTPIDLTLLRNGSEKMYKCLYS